MTNGFSIHLTSARTLMMMWKWQLNTTYKTRGKTKRLLVARDLRYSLIATTANTMHMPLPEFRVIRRLCFKTTFVTVDKDGAGRQNHSLRSFILAPNPATSYARTLCVMPVGQ